MRNIENLCPSSLKHLLRPLLRISWKRSRCPTCTIRFAHFLSEQAHINKLFCFGTSNRNLFMRGLRIHPDNLGKSITTKAEEGTRVQLSCSIVNKRKEVEENVQACITSTTPTQNGPSCVNLDVWGCQQMTVSLSTSDCLQGWKGDYLTRNARYCGNGSERTTLHYLQSLK